MPRRIPIAAARALASEQGLTQVILAAWDGRRTHIVTYGVSVTDCDQAALGGEKIKAALGWPAAANVLPSRVAALQRRVQRLEAAIAWVCGEGDSDFAEGDSYGRPRYWWRAELTRRAGLETRGPGS